MVDKFKKIDDSELLDELRDSELLDELRSRRLDEQIISEASTWELTQELEARGDLPEPDVSELSDEELLNECENRGLNLLQSYNLDYYYRTRNLQEFLIELGRVCPEFRDMDLWIVQTK